MKRLLLIGAIFLAVSQVYAEVPKLINYSGKLTDKAGNIVADRAYDMRFSLWNQPTDGTNVWSEEHYIAQGRGVQTWGGGFNVILGGTTALPAFDQKYWMEVRVTINSTPETFGRQEIISVPYAIRAEHTNQVADGAVNEFKIVSNAVWSGHIKDGEVTTGDLANNSVTQPKAPWAPEVYYNGSKVSNPKIACGGAISAVDGDLTIYFPFTYANGAPHVSCTVKNGSSHAMVTMEQIYTDRFVVHTWFESAGNIIKKGPVEFEWIALGY